VTRTSKYGRKAAKPRQRGSYQRGEDTRRRLVETAIDLFAAHGYDGASTRLLADEAGVNLPAIQYYFGSKEGLYRAAVGHIVERIVDGMRPAAERVELALADGDLSRKRLLALLYEMLDAFLALVADSRHSRNEKLFITRAEIEEFSALEQLHDMVERYVIGPCTALVARLNGGEASDETVMARTLAILGQITIFGHKGPQCTLGWNDMNEERLSNVRQVVHENTAAILRIPREVTR
jgi:TetR/AcrR family transcriptional regulator, regulator of cefoperazone and chloramphenicol sensitivity